MPRQYKSPTTGNWKACYLCSTCLFNAMFHMVKQQEGERRQHQDHSRASCSWKPVHTSPFTMKAAIFIDAVLWHLGKMTVNKLWLQKDKALFFCEIKQVRFLSQCHLMGPLVVFVITIFCNKWLWSSKRKNMIKGPRAASYESTGP